MADPSQDGGQSAPPQPVPVQDQGNDLSSQWSNWLDRPGNRSALMQFGVAMLQPIQQGESFSGHLGNAIASGGEAEHRVQQNALAEQEAGSKEALRASQAENAEARARTAGVASEAQLERLHAGERQHSLQGLLGIQNQYQKFLTDKHKQESDPLSPTRGVGTPDPSIEEWMQSRGMDPTLLHTAMTGGGEDSGGDLQVQPQGKPAVADLSNNPQYGPRIAQAKAAIKTNPQLAQQLIRSLTPMVKDPENLTKLFGG